MFLHDPYFKSMKYNVLCKCLFQKLKFVVISVNTKGRIRACDAMTLFGRYMIIRSTLAFTILLKHLIFVEEASIFHISPFFCMES